MVDKVLDNIKRSVLGGESKYLGGEMWGGAGIVVFREGERPESEDFGSILVYESANSEVVSATIFELRDALRGVMDLDLKDRLYGGLHHVLSAAGGADFSNEDIVSLMLMSARRALRIRGRAYFAYGSNMDVEQMTRRCPSALFTGAAVLKGWEFAIDAGGFATIVEGEGSVEGALWMLSAADELALDHYEGVEGGSYEKRHVKVDGDFGHGTALAHVSLRTPASMKTHRAAYMDRVRRGAEGCGLSDEAKARIASVEVCE
ncbi:gamma-glutamylcyclotransferase family protein [Paratractidigestivibacter sp.]|uniref:gamma-glutamylcyclotransferase family protein n=1 Tax=Paratractidigestivibacter sp. TaxID=2847316 RepID=UPI002ACB06EC|nr:gamma-glutamylcyclotransferase family protein [Paratractidigestivibacter sp.]